MKALHGSAYLRGRDKDRNIYQIFGVLDNGYWFFGDPEGCGIFDADTRTKDSSGRLAVTTTDWYKKHHVTTFSPSSVRKMAIDFCSRLDKKERGLTDGYELFSNYLPGHVSKAMGFPAKRTVFSLTYTDRYGKFVEDQRYSDTKILGKRLSELLVWGCTNITVKSVEEW